MQKLPIMGMLLLICFFNGCKGTPAGEGAVPSAEAVEIVDISRIHKAPAPARRNKPFRHEGNGGKKEQGTAAVSDGLSTAPQMAISGKVTQADGKPAGGIDLVLKSFESGFPRESQPISTALAKADEEGGYAFSGPYYAVNQIETSGAVAQIVVPLHLKAQSLGRDNIARVTKDIVLPVSSDVSGRTLDENNTPLTGVVVHFQAKENPMQTEFDLIAGNHVTTSSFSGDFRFEKLPAGKWTVVADAAGYARLTMPFVTPTTAPLTLCFGARGGTVKGMVVHKSLEQPVAGVKIFLKGQDPSASSVSGSDGTFRFDHVDTGTKTLAVALDEKAALGMAAPQPGSIQVAEGQTTEVTVFVYPGVTVSGMVFDKDTSEPLSGAKVSADQSGLAGSTITDAAGHYVLNGLFPLKGSLRLRVILDSFSTAEEVVLANVPDGSIEASRDIPMVRRVKIRGKVLTSDGAPVPHASVFLRITDFGNSDDRHLVDADGSFEVETRPFLPMLLMVKATGYGDAQSGTIDVAASDINDVIIKMDVASTVSGQVVDSTGAPVAGAIAARGESFELNNMSVSRMADSTQTGSDGSFTFTDLPKITTLQAYKQGTVPSEEMPLKLSPGEVRTGVKLILRDEVSIGGIVVSDKGQPVSMASVQAKGGPVGSRAVTDNDGRFSVKSLVEGTYQLEIYATGGMGTKLTGVKSGTQDLKIVLETKNQPVPWTVRGTVVDDLTGDIIPDFKTSDREIKMLDEPGTFERVYSADYPYAAIQLEAPGYQEQNFPVRKIPGEAILEQTFRLAKGGAITGRVVGAISGKPLAGVTVVNWGSITDPFNRRQSGPKNHVITLEDGQFTLAPAPAGINRLQFKAPPPFGESAKTVTVKNEDVLEMGDVPLVESGSLRGTVTRKAGPPVEGVTVKARATDMGANWERKAVTGPDGTFTMEEVPAAAYIVSAGAMSQTAIVEAGEDAVVNLVLGAVTVKGIVQRNGEAVEATVSLTGADSVRYNAYSFEGNYTINSVLPGSYQLTVEKHSIPGVSQSLEVPDQPVLEHNIELPPLEVKTLPTP